MLPDFPALKAIVLKNAQRRIRALENLQHPILSQIRTFTQHEGTRMDFQQVGYGRKSQNAESGHAEVLVKLEEIPDLVGTNLDKKLAVLADQSGGAKVRSLVARVIEATDLTGKTIDAKGQPPTAALLLDAMEAVDGSFDENGESKMSWLVHPDMLPALQKLSQEVDDDPELRARRDSIRDRHRRQWSDRQNSRKLVD